MAMNPWMAEMVAAERARELQEQARQYRLARAASAAHPRLDRRPGRVARSTGRVLMSLGWRLAGPSAMPSGLEQRLLGDAGHA